MKLRKRLSELKKTLRRDNRGAGLIVVLITVVFILVLAAAILYASYNVFMLRITERKSEKNFTSADAGMNEIRAGLETAVSEAKGAGYDYIIKNYGGGTTEQTFKDGFFTALADAKTFDGQDLPLFRQSSGEITAYNVSALNTFLDTAGHSNFTYTLSAEGGETYDPANPTAPKWGIAVMDRDNCAVTLRGVTLDYIKNGYETKVSTDIYLSVPDTPVTNKAGTSELIDYAIVADQGLVSDRDGVSNFIGGDVYAGQVRIGAQSTLTVNEGCSLIVGQTPTQSTDYTNATIDVTKTSSGNVTVDGAYKTQGDQPNGMPSKNYQSGLILKAGAKLWANEISVTNGYFQMADSAVANVADDLNIGRAADVTLAGTYYGFGNGTPLNPDAAVKPTASDLSSSILFRTGGGTRSGLGSLDMSGLDSLTLAGTSFVQPVGTEKNENNEVQMGSSISSRSEQLAYLVPGNLLTGSSEDASGRTNPEILDTSTDRDAKVATEREALYAAAEQNLDKPLWTVDGEAKSLSDYGITDRSGLKVLSYPASSGSQQVFYVFMNFASREQANAYFKDFFRQNESLIASYIDQYAVISGNPSMSLAGTGYPAGKDKKGNSILPGGNLTVSQDAATDEARKKYLCLSRTMSYDTDSASTPFNSYIDRKKLHAIVDGTDTEAVDQFVRKYTKGSEVPKKDYEDHGTFKQLTLTFMDNTGTQTKFILAYGNYNGENYDATTPLVVCDGDVKLSNSGITHGLIICSGTATLNCSGYTLEKDNAKETGARDDVVKLLQSLDLYAPGGGHNPKDEDFSSPDETVQFRNWKKNKSNEEP